MVNIRISSLAFLVFECSRAQAATPPFSHAIWDNVVKEYVNEAGEVDYSALKQKRKQLDEYIRRLGEVSPAKHPKLFPDKEHRLAYWINAYNAFTTNGVLDGYPTKSVLDIRAVKGFFWHKDYVAGGERMSLMHLENNIIRKFGDPRIHFAIVCASLGCPFLAREAFTPETLNTMLDQGARAFVNDSRNVTIDQAANLVTLSKIFEWYKKDFGATSDADLLPYIRQYANDGTRQALDKLKSPRVKFREYDWSLNDIGSRSKTKVTSEADNTSVGLITSGWRP